MTAFIKLIIFFPVKFFIRLSKIFVWISQLYVLVLKRIFGKDYKFLLRHSSDIYEIFDNVSREVSHLRNNGDTVKLKFFIPNAICRVRADTFSIKEPEILNWIDENGDDSTFWDVGACIGLYSIYYAKTQKGKVVAFEPSFFNLRQLAKNITVNNVHDRIDVIPLPLTDTDGFQNFVVSGGEEGGAANAFGVGYGGDGKRLNIEFQYRTLGFSADKLLEKELNSQIPKLIKIDVDGIEHLVLRGMTNILKSPKCKSVYVEVNDSFTEQAMGVALTLTDSGFVLKERYEHKSTNDQIWFKKSFC